MQSTLLKFGTALALCFGAADMAHATQNGGTVTINAGATVSDTSTQPSITADGSGTGDGGTISITSDNLAVGTVTFSASGGTTSGEGGTLDIENTTAVDISQWTINLPGYGTGKGGDVTIALATGAPTDEFINVESIINVEDGNEEDGGGTPAIVRPRDQRGAEPLQTINSVVCQKVETSNTTWPIFFWNCSDLNNPNTYPADIAFLIPNSVPALLGQNNTNIRVFATLQTFQNFYHTSEQSTGGYSLQDGNGTYVSSVFEEANLPSTGLTTLVENQIKETTVHELGHIVGVVNGNENTGTTIAGLLLKDQQYIDQAGSGLPCSTSGTAPFDGVTDTQTGQPFCTGAVLTDPKHLYTGLTKNSQIASRSSPQLKYTKELYSQGFAWQVLISQSLTSGPYFDPTADGLFQKGFYACARVLPASRAGGTLVPGYACN